ncbi:MAG: metallophosphoesterase [Chloroflexi bacterium]|nr:metallophosphoesterase [Chloroflexota bacterium]
MSRLPPQLGLNVADIAFIAEFSYHKPGQQMTAFPSLKILAVCDEVDSRLYGTNGCAARISQKPDLLVSCGDLPPYYLDYLVSKLDVPLYAVHGNHDAVPPLEGSEGYNRCGAHWLGGRGIRTDSGLLLAGFDGSLRYNSGAYQSSQKEMQAAVHSLVPWLLMNKLRFGRFLDVLITHAPPKGIHDEPDRCHTGFDAYNWLIRAFRPRYHLHGHIHLYDRRAETVTRVGETEVINVYPFRELELSLPEVA